MVSSLLPIGEVARRTGLAASALRYYDELGLVTPTARIAGQRRYDAAAVHRLEAVGLLQRVGFSLDEIARLLDGDQDWRPLAHAKADALERRQAELAHARSLLGAALACDCERLEACGRLHHLDDPVPPLAQP